MGRGQRADGMGRSIWVGGEQGASEPRSGKRVSRRWQGRKARREKQARMLTRDGLRHEGEPKHLPPAARRLHDGVDAGQQPHAGEDEGVDGEAGHHAPDAGGHGVVGARHGHRAPQQLQHADVAEGCSSGGRAAAWACSADSKAVSECGCVVEASQAIFPIARQHGVARIAGPHHPPAMAGWGSSFPPQHEHPPLKATHSHSGT